MKQEKKYTQFALSSEMMETPGIIRTFKRDDLGEVVAAVKKSGKLFLTGEGSSRIFPAKNAIAASLRAGRTVQIATDGGRQAAEYDLGGFAVFGASNKRIDQGSDHAAGSAQEGGT